jgi:hypothetical protein
MFADATENTANGFSTMIQCYFSVAIIKMASGQHLALANCCNCWMQWFDPRIVGGMIESWHGPFDGLENP